MSTTEVIGGIAACLTVFNMLPQYLKVMRTKHTKDLSRPTFISLSCSASLWVIYGILKHDSVIIFANTPAFFFVASILIMKIKHG